jgi:hypothetical protein
MSAVAATPADVLVAEEGEKAPTVVPAKLSWGALIGAVFVVLGLFTLLMTIGLAVGLTALEPADPGSARPAAVGIGIWSVVAIVVSLFVGALLASRTAGFLDRTVGAMHGVVLWGIATTLMLFFLGSTVRAIGSGVANLGQAAVSAGGAGVGAAVTGGDELSEALGISTDDLMAAINERLRAEGKPAVTADQVKTAIQDVTRTAIVEGRIDRELFVSSITENTRISRQGATDLVARMEEELNRRKEALAASAGGAVLRAAEGVGRAMWWPFVGLLLGLGAAALGGALGVRQKQAVPAERPATVPPTPTESTPPPAPAEPVPMTT